MIDDTRDVIEYQVDETWDITGWDLRKALRLFRGTNSAMIERLYSPITYINCGDFKQQLLALTPQYYAPKSGMYHYLSMTRNLFEKDLQGADIRLKKYFYALRTSLAALWIAQNQSAPPMTLGELRINLPTHLNSVVDDMIALKSVSNEQKIVTPNDGLHRFIQNTIEICQVVASQFQEHFNDSSDLNRLFKNTLAQI
jgi:predicted nucleotidyltransferase